MTLISGLLSAGTQRAGGRAGGGSSVKLPLYPANKSALLRGFAFLAMGVLQPVSKWIREVLWTNYSEPLI